MKSLKECYVIEDKLLNQLAKIQTKITKHKKNTLVQCVNNCQGLGCGMRHKIKDLEYIQTHWYESPHGCTGGDTWHSGEGNFICPHCEHRNRLYDRPEIQDLKHLFKITRDEYDE